MVSQRVGLQLRLNALRKGCEPERATEIHDGLGECSLLLVSGHAIDEGFCDLQEVDREAVEASFRDGLLRITLPNRGHRQPHPIRVAIQ